MTDELLSPFTRKWLPRLLGLLALILFAWLLDAWEIPLHVGKFILSDYKEGRL